MHAVLAATESFHVNAVLFYALAALALAGAIGVVISRNPIHSALFLVATMITIAVFFLTLSAPMVAIVQVIVYASAIVVLFLFVIMLLGIDRHEMLATDDRRYQRIGGAVLGACTLVALIGMTVANWQLGAQTASGRAISAPRPALTGDPKKVIAQTGDVDNVRPLARTLFTQFAWQFQVTAALLVIAVVGSVVLARRSSRPRREEVAA
jgi:NADH-quinone oxidoreductase subunit J